MGEEERTAALEALAEAFSRDRLELDELERRIDRVNAASRKGELRSLLADLPQELLPPVLRTGSGPPSTRSEGSSSRPSRPAGTDPSSTGSRHPPERTLEVAVWSGRVRRGRWTPGRRVTVVAFQGGVELDFREADLGPEPVDLFVFALMGGIEIIVPPWIAVHGSASAFMGGYEEDEWTGVESDQDSPVLRVSGFVMMGAVEVIVRYPGESKREAKARRRDDRSRRRLEDPRP